MNEVIILLKICQSLHWHLSPSARWFVPTPTPLIKINLLFLSLSLFLAAGSLYSPLVTIFPLRSLLLNCFQSDSVNYAPMDPENRLRFYACKRGWRKVFEKSLKIWWRQAILFKIIGILPCGRGFSLFFTAQTNSFNESQNICINFSKLRFFSMWIKLVLKFYVVKVFMRNYIRSKWKSHDRKFDVQKPQKNHGKVREFFNRKEPVKFIVSRSNGQFFSTSIFFLVKLSSCQLILIGWNSIVCMFN